MQFRGTAWGETLAFAKAWALGPGPDVGRGHRVFTYGLFSFVNRRPSALPRASSPTWSACRGHVSPWALDPRHGPPLRGSHTPEGLAVLTHLCRVPSPRVFSLRLEQTRPHFCKAGLALLCCLQGQVLRTRLCWAVTRSTPWPLSWLLCRPISLSQNPPPRQTGFLASPSPAPAQSGCF